MVLPLLLYIASLAALISIGRSLLGRRTRAPTRANSWEAAELLFFAMLAFGVGSCSAYICMPGHEVFGNDRWPACLGLATLAVFTFVAGQGRRGRTAPPAWVSYMLMFLAIAMVVAAVKLLER